ncbi:MAG: phospho-N-acetylmuramoyl-pentapeptide-transferase [bacterium]|nr:phospho-N-acetylmuramoyl-pentapeptide-transferase [bacterium]
MIENFAIVKMLIVSTLGFILAMIFTPAVTRFLYKHKLGKKIRDAKHAPIFHKLHIKKAGTPTMGGLVIWVPVLVLTRGSGLLVGTQLEGWNFLSRGQTWLPLAALVAAGIVGIFDDYLNARGLGGNGGGLKVRHRLGIYTVIALVGAWWFAFKLDWDILHIPFVGDINVGLWYFLIFAFIIVATSFSVNQTDGLDGLAGGALLTSFSAYGVIALLQGKEDLAVFCAVIAGAILAFLWFNINPARFFMGDTGSMSLGVTLGIVAMLTNQVLLLPIIGVVFVIEAISTLVQYASKKCRGKKCFLSSPLHHHYEAVGWPEPKIVMRAWVISMVAAGVGVALAVLDLGTSIL